MTSSAYSSPNAKLEDCGNEIFAMEVCGGFERQMEMGIVGKNDGTTLVDFTKAMLRMLF